MKPTLNPLSALALVALASPAALAQGGGADSPSAWTLQDGLALPAIVRVEGSIRGRYEALANPFVAGRTDDDEFLGLQTLLRAELDLGSPDGGLTIGGELLDSRFIAGNETGGAPGEIDTLEPSQAYLAWRPRDFLARGAKLDLTAGRFTMDIGSRRLVARANYRSILASFDGVRATWTSADRLAATLAIASPTLRAPGDAASALGNEVALNPTLDNLRFALAHVDAPLPLGLRAELYAMDLDEHDDADAATRNRDYLTLGARLRKLPSTSALDFDLEYVRQTGSARATTSALDVSALEHEAEMVHLEAAFSFDAPWSPRLSLQYDFASGDRSPVDSSSERFDPLFGDRSFEFGPTSTYGFIARTNFSSPGIRLEVKPDGDSDAYLMVRDVRLDEARDSLANSGDRDATGLSGEHVGVQIEGRYRRWLVKDSLRATIGAAAVFAGRFLELAPNAPHQGDPVYAFTDLTWTF